MGEQAATARNGNFYASTHLDFSNLIIGLLLQFEHCLVVNVIKQRR